MAEGYAGIPAGPLSAYLGVRQANEERGNTDIRGTLFQAQTMGLLQKMQQEQQDRQEIEQLKGVVAPAKGDPKEAHRLLIAHGTPKAYVMAHQLEGMLKGQEGQQIGTGLRMPDGTIIAPPAKPETPFSNIKPVPHGYLDMNQKNPDGSPKFFKTQQEPNPPTQPLTRGQVIDPKDPTRLLEVDLRIYKQGGTLGDPGVFGVAGREPTSAKRDEQKDAGKQQLADAVGELSVAYDNLSKMGAGVNPSNSGVTNVWERAAASGPGQFVAGALGTSAQTQRDIIASRRASLMASLKQATGLGAQQLNSNAELMFYIGMATDPAKSIPANRAALSYLNKTYDLGLNLPSDPDVERQLAAIAPKQNRPKPIRGAGAPAGGVPAGVDPKVWGVMTPEERALFR